MSRLHAPLPARFSFSPGVPAPRRQIDCSTEAAALIREQAELPRLDVASPADRPPYCITLETIMAFASRVKAHAARCPQSDHIPTVVEWDNRRTAYSRLFSQYRCKRTR